MKKSIIKEDELDFLNEIINIGSGNAAKSLEQLLGAAITMEMPELRIMTHEQLSSLMGSLTAPVIGVRMGILGDMSGYMFFVMPDKDKAIIKELAERAREGYGKIEIENDYTLIEEIANIMAGVLLYSIHDFCGLNVIHTVPDSSVDMLLSLIDESIAVETKIGPYFIMIESVFMVDGKPKNAISGKKVKVMVIIILAVDSIKAFRKSIATARKKMMSE